MVQVSRVWGITALVLQNVMNSRKLGRHFLKKFSGFFRTNSANSSEYTRNMPMPPSTMPSTSFSSATTMEVSMVNTKSVIAQKVARGMVFMTMDASFKKNRLHSPRNSVTFCRSSPLSSMVAAAPAKIARKMICSISVPVNAPTKLVGTILTMESSREMPVELSAE